VFFNANCNEQVFLLNPEKNFAQIDLVVFEKNALQFRKNVTEPKANLFYNQLNC